MRPRKKAKLVSNCLELAILLEASASKPGNVNRLDGFGLTRYEHFLASAVAASTSFELAAERGIAISQGRLRIEDVELGRIIRDCILDINSWENGGNTLLGATLLLIPLAVAAGMSPVKRKALDVKAIRRNLRPIVESSTSEDAVNVYEAIRMANPGGLGKVSDLDVSDPDAIGTIRTRRVTLYDVFKTASSYDMICREWVNDYAVTFDVAYQSLKERLASGGNLNEAIIYAFIRVLAEYPDTLISRKTSIDEARKVSSMADRILKSGLETQKWERSLVQFDRVLRRYGNLLNPGTTADLTASALALCLLEGYRP